MELQIVSNRKTFLLITAAALFIRIVYLLLAPQTPVLTYYNFDEGDYELIAKNVYEGNGYCYIKGQPTAFRPPLYPLMIASIYQITGKRSHLAVKLTQALISAVTAGLIFLLASIVLSRAAGLWAGMLFCIYPIMLYYVPKLLTETLFIALLCASLCLLLFAVKRGAVKFYALAGLAFGVAFLCRPVLLPFLVGLFVPMIILLARRGAIKGPLVRGASLLLVFVVVISPWVIRNYVVFDEFIPTDTHLGWVLWHNTKVHFDFDADFEKSRREIDEAQAAGTLTSESFFDAIQRHAHYGAQAQQDGIRKAYDPTQMPQSETEISRFFIRKTFEFFRDKKLRLVRDRVANFINFWMPISSTEGRKGEYQFMYGVMALFALVGLYFAFKERRLLDLLPLLLIVANFWIATTVFIYHSRLKMPADIVTIVLAGYSIDAIRRAKGVRWLACLAAAAIGLNLIACFLLAPLKGLIKSVF
ncbi:glycosyltransferase family 39 protein [bacterium]|nr:glycosyltransferase family 39 protein [bacterium]